MPGRLIMESQGAGGSQDLKKDRSQAQGHIAPQDEDQMHTNTSLGHGGIGALANGASTRDNDSKSSINDSVGAVLPLKSAGPPPELDQSWRSSDGNKSMGVLIERLAQQCVSDLGDVVSKMSEIQTESHAPQPNGIAASHTTDTSETSLSKKRTFMEFAKDQRDRFTKTLVLSDWCRNGEDMAKLVDLKVWQEKWTAAQNTAIWSIGQTKHDLSRNGSKLPNPNIEGALELLATGKSRYPDLGYLPPKRLSARQLLNTLQDMNVTLATRLNLHEDLPAHFNSYTIANGRATFRVPGEFEVDLSIADEDETSQFYFIDVRFLFSPASDRLPDDMCGQLEGRTNAALAAKGLRGCYDFLHNFALTYKINTLGDQARELIRGKWFESLRIEQKRRILVIQYWSSRPSSGKSWIEIGISSGKQNGPHSRRNPTSRLSARWLRKTGSETEATNLDFDTESLDVEQILHAAIARHATWQLTKIRDALQSIGGKHSKLHMELQESSSIPEECSLMLSFPNMGSPLTVRLEPILGRIAISPSTAPAGRMEHLLNGEPDQDVPRGLAYLACSSVQERITRAADLAGWRARPLLRQPNIQALLGAHTLARNVYTCSPSWGDEWALIVTFSLTGEDWLVARLESKTDGRSNTSGHIISAVHKISVDAALGPSPIASRTSMLRIEKLAAAEVSFTALSQQLGSMHIQFHIERLQTLVRKGQAPGPDSLYSTAMDIDSSSLLKQLDDRGRPLAAVGPVRVSHLGFDDVAEDHGVTMATQELRLTLQPGKLPFLREYLRANNRDPEIAMNESGALAIRIRTPFGRPFVQQIQSRLRLCERLDYFLGVLKTQGVKCTSASLSKIAFTYRDTPELGASITYAEDGNSPVTVEFEPNDSNPHQRIRLEAAKLLNGGTKSRDSFMVLVKVLTMSLSLLETFDKLTSAHREKRTLEINPHQVMHYGLCYQAPLPAFVIDIMLKAHDLDGSRKLVWSVNLSSPKLQSSAIPDELKKALTDLFKQKGKGWYGINSGGIVAHPDGISEVVLKVDELLRRFEGTAIGEPKTEENSAAQPSVVNKQESTASLPKAQPGGPTTVSAPKSGPQQQQRTTPATPATQQKANGPTSQQQARPAQMQRSGSQQQQKPAAAQMQRSASQQQRVATNGAAPPQARPGARKNTHEVIELD